MDGPTGTPRHEPDSGRPLDQPQEHPGRPDQARKQRSRDFASEGMPESGPSVLQTGLHRGDETGQSAIEGAAVRSLRSLQERARSHQQGDQRDNADPTDGPSGTSPPTDNQPEPSQADTMVLPLRETPVPANPELNPPQTQQPDNTYYGFGATPDAR